MRANPGRCARPHHPQIIDAYLSGGLKLELREKIADNLKKPDLRPEEKQVLTFLRRRLKS